MLFPGEGASSCGCRPAVHHPDGSCTCPSGAAAFQAAMGSPAVPFQSGPVSSAMLQTVVALFLGQYTPCLYISQCCSYALAACTVCLHACNISDMSVIRKSLFAHRQVQARACAYRCVTHDSWLVRHSCVNPIQHGWFAKICVAVHHQTQEEGKKLVACAAE